MCGVLLPDCFVEGFEVFGEEGGVDGIVEGNIGHGVKCNRGGVLRSSGEGN